MHQVEAHVGGQVFSAKHKEYTTARRCFDRAVTAMQAQDMNGAAVLEVRLWQMGEGRYGSKPNLLAKCEFMQPVENYHE